MTGIVTGTTGGIGRAVCKRLQDEGHTVVSLRSRLERTEALEEEIKAILREYERIDFLIHAAGIGVFEPMETLSISTINRLIAVNLTAPIVLAKLLLPALKRSEGTIVHITSVEATRAAKYSALYSASKAGLRHFSHTLFEEVRKNGVKVCSINPDVTDTPFFENNNLKFRPQKGELYALDPDEVADAVMWMLQSKGVVTDMTLRPKRIGIVKR
jgi:short-subunit dehydrogenase